MHHLITWGCDYMRYLLVSIQVLWSAVCRHVPRVLDKPKAYLVYKQKDQRGNRRCEYRRWVYPTWACGAEEEPLLYKPDYISEVYRSAQPWEKNHWIE